MNFKDKEENKETGNVFDDLYLIVDMIIMSLIFLEMKNMIVYTRLSENLFEKICFVTIIALLSKIISVIENTICKQ